MMKDAVLDALIGTLFHLGGALCGMMATASIVTDPSLRWWCLFGACIGAFVSVSMVPKLTRRQQIAQWIAAAGVGMVATPAAMRYLKWEPDPDTVLGIAALIGFVAWATLPAIQGLFARFLNSKVPPANDDSKPQG